MIYKTPFILCVVGALLLAVSIVLPLGFPSLFKNKLTQKLIIRPDSDMLKSFQRTPMPFSFQVYIFNTTNAEAILNGAKPKLDQLGPYTYRMTKERVGIEFDQELGTVSYRTRAFFYFEPEASSGTEKDIVTTIDPVFTAILSKADEDEGSSIMKSLVQTWIVRFDLTPFMTRTVGEVLFDGYEDGVIKELYKLTKKESLKSGRSGYLRTKNDTLGGIAEIMTGELGMNDYQNLMRYNGKKSLDIWNEKRCNMFNGTTGSMFARPIRTDEPLRLYSFGLCRSIYFEFEKDVSLGPLALHRFRLPSEVLMNTEENECFRISNFTYRSSMLDLSKCRGGSPLILSTAHYYGGSKSDIEAVEGLNPNKNEHETYVDVEPNTGVTMRAAKRMQINMPLRRYANIPILKNVPELVYPVLWMNESIVTPLERVNKLHKTLTLPVIVVKYGACGLLLVGLFLVFIAAICTYKIYQKNDRLGRRRQELRDKIFEVNNLTLFDKSKPSV